MVDDSQQQEWERHVFDVLGCDTPQQRSDWDAAVQKLDPFGRARRLSEFVQQTAFDRWAPRLREFADECRLSTPPPGHSSLSPVDIEQRRILRMMLERRRGKIDSLQPRAHTAAIACTELVALRDLIELFAPSSDIACLTPQEWHVWNNEIYDHRVESKLGYWWCDIHYWTLTRTPTDNPSLSSLPPEIRGAPDYWIVSEGHASGSLCGSGTDDIWHWDGIEATQLDGGSLWVS